MVLRMQPPYAFFFTCFVPSDVQNIIGIPITIFLSPHNRTVTVKYLKQIFDLSTKKLFLPCLHPSCLNLVATH